MKPLSKAEKALSPFLASSRIRSLIRMLASTPKPMPRMMPAMPGKVSVAPMIFRTPKVRTRWRSSVKLAIMPHEP